MLYWIHDIPAPGARRTLRGRLRQHFDSGRADHDPLALKLESFGLVGHVAIYTIGSNLICIIVRFSGSIAILET